MASKLASRIAEEVARATPLYHRLVVVVGPPGSGKTSALRELHAERGWPLLNLNLALSERLLEYATRQRALKVSALAEDLVAATGAEVVQLDNLEMLFHPDLKLDPLRLLHTLSRHRTIVASWRGHRDGAALTYAAREHREYRRCDAADARLVEAGGASALPSDPESPPSAQDSRTTVEPR